MRSYADDGGPDLNAGHATTLIWKTDILALYLSENNNVTVL